MIKDYLKPLFFVLVLSVGVLFVSAFVPTGTWDPSGPAGTGTWNPPGPPSPETNVAPPINAGHVDQVKLGGLGVLNLTASNIDVSGSITAGNSITAQSINVSGTITAGRITANEICMADVCVTDWSMLLPLLGGGSFVPGGSTGVVNSTVNAVSNFTNTVVDTITGGGDCWGFC
ncbi:MAG: hypothetical protein AAB355_00640 [Patescibacteria group bacterium]